MVYLVTSITTGQSVDPVLLGCATSRIGVTEGPCTDMKERKPSFLLSFLPQATGSKTGGYEQFNGGGGCKIPLNFFLGMIPVLRCFNSTSLQIGFPFASFLQQMHTHSMQCQHYCTFYSIIYIKNIILISGV